MVNPPPAYIGRFAPSPTGPLHFGSLIAAVASFLDARANAGHWLLRMEDLDPPREPAGAAERILDQIQHLGMHWDGEVLYQSTRLAAYEAALDSLRERGLCYPCVCSRQRIRELNSVYDGHCRDIEHPPGAAIAWRCLTRSLVVSIEDQIQGCFEQNIELDCGDFVIRRKDSLFAYQLAVVIDDAHQAITHVIRGHDLLDSTPRQVYLQGLFQLPSLNYGHVPVVVNELGQKLSKQHFATPIETDNGTHMIHLALSFLGHSPPSARKFASPAEILDWGISHWDIQAVPKLATIKQSDSPAG